MHPGFVEEKEWRVLYIPDVARSDQVLKAHETIAGIPQTVYKLPVRDISKIDRIIIGPTRMPKTIADAFTDLLGSIGVAEPASKVVISEIPRRR